MEKEIIITREEFDAMIDSMTSDEIIDIIPHEIIYKTGYDDPKRPNHMTRWYDKVHIKIQLGYNISEWVFNIFYDNKTDLARKNPVHFKSIIPRHAIKKMIHYLFDNWHLSDYIKSLQLNQPTLKKI